MIIAPASMSWHDAVAQAWAREIAAHLGTDGRVALLIWGDPSLYDSSLRIARRLTPPPAIEVIPGITAIQALCAAHEIPLNEIGKPFLVTTGRQLRDKGWPAGVETVVVMLDGGTAFQALDAAGAADLVGCVSRYASSDHPVRAACRGRCEDCRKRAAEARARHGWIMDSYIIRRGSA